MEYASILYLVDGKVISFLDSGGRELACFDIIVHGSATNSKHRHDIVSINPFGNRIIDWTF